MGWPSAYGRRPRTVNAFRSRTVQPLRGGRCRLRRGGAVLVPEASARSTHHPASQTRGIRPHPHGRERWRPVARPMPDQAVPSPGHARHPRTIARSWTRARGTPGPFSCTSMNKVVPSDRTIRVLCAAETETSSGPKGPTSTPIITDGQVAITRLKRTTARWKSIARRVVLAYRGSSTSARTERRRRCRPEP